MPCFGLPDAPCSWMLRTERRSSTALNLLDRFGFTTGAAIAAGLILLFMIGRRLLGGAQP